MPISVVSPKIRQSLSGYRPAAIRCSLGESCRFREVIESIRERVDLVQLVSQTVTLKRRGDSMVGLCPFHQEKTPSFGVVPHKNIFHCFGCGEGGDCFQVCDEDSGVSRFTKPSKNWGSQVGVEIEDKQVSEAEKQRIQKASDPL